MAHRPKQAVKAIEATAATAMEDEMDVDAMAISSSSNSERISSGR